MTPSGTPPTPLDHVTWPSITDARGHSLRITRLLSSPTEAVREARRQPHSPGEEGDQPSQRQPAFAGSAEPQLAGGRD